LNILRITIILVLGYHYGDDLALQTFHSLGGWVLIFFGTLILLAISEKLLKTQIFSDKKGKCEHYDLKSSLGTFCNKCGRILKTSEVKMHKTDAAKIGAILIVSVLLTTIQAPVFALTQAKPIIVVNDQFSTEILPQISDYNLDFISREIDFEAKAKQDMSLIYLYTSYNQSKEPVKVTIEIASAKSSLHRWETCLITWPVAKGYQTKVSQIELKDFMLNENPPIIGRYFLFKYIDTNETQAVLYWYETATFTINSTSQQKHVKISLIAYPEDANSLSNIENQLLNMATYVVGYWQPIKTWSQITMIISQNGATLAIVTAAVLAGTLTLFFFETRAQKKADLNAYQKLSKPNKQIVDAILETEKTTTPTLEAIAAAYQKITGKQTSKEQLLKNISKLEKTNTIRGYVANIRDEPLQAWKTTLK
ncbi:MAG: exosortase/archaeosortase family protein, partial [Candidatus Bathyarchaeia archaeon]